MSHKNYQSNTYKKKVNSKNSFQRPLDKNKKSRWNKEEEDNIIDWVTFYRRNIHRFIQHYLMISLFPYQRLWVYLISRSTQFLGYASRASAKSWLIAVWGAAHCILYPGSIITINSSTKKQASLIITEKLVPLIEDHPNLQREIIREF